MPKNSTRHEPSAVGRDDGLRQPHMGSNLSRSTSSRNQIEFQSALYLPTGVAPLPTRQISWLIASSGESE